MSSVGNMAAHDLTTFGGRVEAALDVIGKRKTDLAAHLGISKQALGQITSGQRPGYEYRYKIADFCAVPLQWLITGTGGPEWTQRTQAETEVELRRMQITINALSDQLGAAQEELIRLRAELAEERKQRRRTADE